MRRFFRIGIIVIFSCGIWSLSESSDSDSDSNWQLLLQQANKIYRGIDLEVDVEIERADEKIEKGIVVRIPIFSFQEREKKRKAKIEFLTKGAEILKEIEIAETMLKIYKEESIVLKKSLEAMGIEGLEKYFDVKIKLAEAEAKLNQKKREFEILCGKK